MEGRHRGGAASPALASQVHCPIAHQPLAALEEVGAPIGRMDLVLDDGHLQLEPNPRYDRIAPRMVAIVAPLTSDHAPEATA